MSATTTLNAYLGALVTDDMRADRNTHTLTVESSWSDIPLDVIDQGFQLAEYRNTGFRLFIKVTDRQRRVRTWGGYLANEVELFEVETTVRESGDSFAIWAEPGERRGTGLIRNEMVREVTK